MAETNSKDQKMDNPIQPVTSAAEGETLKTTDDTVLDEAAKYLANTEEYGLMTPEKEKEIVKKIDAWMIPMLLFAATLGAVDKVQIGTASLYGFQTDNHMVGQEYSWLGSILPLGTLIGLVPASYLVQRIPPARLLCTASIMWSILTICYAACSSWSGFMALRFWLGFLEAAITPSLTMIVASFYKKSEQPPRNAIIFAYFSSVFNGFFAWVVGKIPESAPLFKWQYLYIMTGSINILYSIALFFMLPDSPMNARFLSKEQKFHAVQRLADNRTGIYNKVWKWNQVWEALTDVKIWLVFLFNIIINIPNGGLQTFGSIIINDLGFGSLESSLLTMPFGIVATGGAWVFSYIAAKWHNRRTLVASMALLLPILGTALVYGLPKANIPGQMVGLYFMYFYWPPYVIGISLPQANVAGHTKKSIAYSLVTIGYAAGNLIGPQTFRSDQAPKYTSGVVTMLVCYCISMVILFAYWAVATFENKRRDRKYGKPTAVHTGTVEGFVDITDRKQKDFRYTT
ncbi:putative Major facilitator superfamily (MFS) profile domain-containing protein [Seiridium unicorne]|uniref:Major facilitator superfamily (MFS) profile domain-containing protein n=1 Tax=Seiridium unicorne TaxID=138068 RepID=A0ABR2UET3_9PEZI